MSDGVIINCSSVPLWDRSTAIHEAGHAVAAWLTGSRSIEISLADEFRIARLSNGDKTEDCRAVCSHRPMNKDRLASLVVTFSGVMAEHLLTGEEPAELFKKGGKGDASDIQQVIEQYRSEGAEQQDCDDLYARSYTLSLKLVTRYWWEIIALAKMTEHYDYVPFNKIASLMTSFYSTQSPAGTLEMLESDEG